MWLCLLWALQSVASQSSDVTVIVDGKKIDFPDAPAFIDENGRTQIPIRFVGEALGAKVGWDGLI